MTSPRPTPSNESRTTPFDSPGGDPIRRSNDTLVYVGESRSPRSQSKVDMKTQHGGDVASPINNMDVPEESRGEARKVPEDRSEPSQRTTDGFEAKTLVSQTQEGSGRKGNSLRSDTEPDHPKQSRVNPKECTQKMPAAEPSPPPEFTTQVRDDEAPPLPRRGKQRAEVRPHISGLNGSTSRDLSVTHVNPSSRVPPGQNPSESTSMPQHAQPRELEQNSMPSTSTQINPSVRVSFPPRLPERDGREARNTTRKPVAQDRAQNGSGIKNATRFYSRRFRKLVVKLSTDKQFWKRKVNRVVGQIENVGRRCKVGSAANFAASTGQGIGDLPIEYPILGREIFDEAPGTEQNTAARAAEVPEEVQTPLPKPETPTTLLPLCHSVEADVDEAHEAGTWIRVYIQAGNIDRLRVLTRSTDLPMYISSKDLRRALGIGFQPGPSRDAPSGSAPPPPRQPGAQDLRSSPPNGSSSHSVSSLGSDTMRRIEERMAGLETRISFMGQQITRLQSDRGVMSKKVSSDVSINGYFSNYAFKTHRDHERSAFRSRPRPQQAGPSEDKAVPSNPPVVACNVCKREDCDCRFGFHHSDVVGESGDDGGRRSCQSPRPTMQECVGQRNYNMSRPQHGDNRPDSPLDQRGKGKGKSKARDDVKISDEGIDEAK